MWSPETQHSRFKTQTGVRKAIRFNTSLASGQAALLPCRLEERLSISAQHARAAALAQLRSNLSAQVQSGQHQCLKRPAVRVLPARVVKHMQREEPKNSCYCQRSNIYAMRRPIKPQGSGRSRVRSRPTCRPRTSWPAACAAC